ncbi:MAG TPA: short-chain dehydrogenase [Chitinophagaceae bacterium]|nr:short-chain dehydrogenase [Chitinophagaceae bacterium]
MKTTKVALVTGAYKGLGFEWCKQLALAGYTVVLTARSLLQATNAAAILQAAGASVHPYAVDVTNESHLQDLATFIQARFGQLDLIINNAGVNPKDYADKQRMAATFKLEHLQADAMLEVLHINSIAPLLVVKHCRQLLQQSNHPIVLNISSWLSSVSNNQIAGHYGYTGSKNLLNMLNVSMANELRNEGIVCINVNPGWVQTDMGGNKAQLTTEASVTAMITNIVSKVTLADTGKFFHYDGTLHPW